MICRYETTVIARCPVDPTVIDVYQATFESERIIKVEDIVEAVRSIFGAGPSFQEAITQNLSDLLTCKVTTVGLHSNVKTTVVAQ